MNLLLFLSALLSAIGGSGGARAAQTPVVLSRSVIDVAQATVAKRAAIASRPTQSVAGPAQTVAALPAAWTLRQAIRVYLARRRE